MASGQLRRENNTDKSDKKQIHVEKDKVPKMKTHFESLTVKDTGDQPHVVRHVIGTMHGTQEEKMQDTTQSMQKKGPSHEEISKDRGTQQNSMDISFAAEETSRKSKEMDGSLGQNEEKSSVQKVKEYTTQTALENVARASDFVVVKGQQTKESLSSATHTAAEKAAKAKDYTLEKSLQAKDVVAEKTTGIAGATVDVTKKSASYVGEKVAAAKDVAVETEKTTVGVVSKVAGVVKDKAVVTGWSAAEYASDKAVGVTETMANVTAGVAGYAGDTVVKTKDVLVDVGKKTKDMVVSTEESVKDFAARKKAEKQRELEAKNSKDQDEFWEEETETKKGYDKWGDDQGYNQGGMMQEGDFEYQQGGGKAEGGFEHQEGGVGVGVMRIIGETLVEIGQNTKDMLTGRQGGRYEGEEQRRGGS
nr:hypothetical protein [Tanacetum cinerariifolium]